MKKSNLKYQY